MQGNGLLYGVRGNFNPLTFFRKLIVVANLPARWQAGLALLLSSKLDHCKFAPDHTGVVGYFGEIRDTNNEILI